MIKVLITAIFLSQALIQGGQCAANDDNRWVNNIHRHRLGNITMVVTPDSWSTPKAPVPYYQFWDCAWRQTAQQCVAIDSMLQQELGR